MNDFDLDKVLMNTSDKEGESYFRIRDAVEGVQIFGGIGSGKTSGTGRFIALSYLKNGFGGLVLTAKPDERALWESYCRETGRLDDLVVIEPGGDNYFNFLEYESSYRDGRKSFTTNIVDVLNTVLKAGELSESGVSNESFWQNARDMLIFNVVDLCLLAFGKVTIDSIYDLVMAAPKPKPILAKTPSDQTDMEEGRKNFFTQVMNGAKRKMAQQVNDWKKTAAGQVIYATGDKVAIETAILKNISDARLMRSIEEFFQETYKNLSDRTRSIIEFSFSGFLFQLMKEPVYSLLCQNPFTVTPEDSLTGKIILLDLPVKVYNKAGRDTQILFKYIWQRAMERRNVAVNDRPVFLWADEAQNFIHEHDADFQATARSSMIATVYLSQNMPNYLSNIGGRNPTHKIKSFLGTLNTKFFHANADVDTNNYASDLIGNGYRENETRTVTSSDNYSVSRGKSWQLEKMVRPEELANLKTGGPLNKRRVQAYMHRQGRVFQGGLNHRLITFYQKQIP